MALRSVNSKMPALGVRLKQLAKLAGDIIYPPVCIGCGEPCYSHGGLCGRCWSALNLLEKPWCDVMGTPFSHDQGEDALSAEAIADPPPFAKARSVVIYDSVARSLVHRLKYNDRLDLAGVMAGWMARAGKDVIAAADVVIPVPLHRRRLLTRQHNQAAELARALASHSDLSYLPAVLARTRATRQQVGLGTKARADNVRGAFTVTAHKRSQVAGKSVLLVDDVYTTGATVKSATRSLLKAGAEKVYVLTFARVVHGRD
ncbi:MAG: ComF family protein [Pseudomonadota bacterium]